MYVYINVLFEYLLSYKHYIGVFFLQQFSLELLKLFYKALRLFSYYTVEKT